MSEEEGKTVDADFEEGLLDPSTTVSMTSQRRYPATKTEPENCNGLFKGAGQNTPNTHGISQNKPELITYDELPTWYQDNEHIVGGYRPESFSTSACFASLRYMHNETVNMYTHLIPAILFLFAQAFVLYLLHRQYPEAKAVDYIVFSFFLLSACITLSLSFLYHTLMNHSMGISYLWLRLDYVGILALTLGDFVSGIRVGFYCDPTLQKIYWSMVRMSQPILPSTTILPFVFEDLTLLVTTQADCFPPHFQTLTLGLLTSILVIHPKYFQTPRYRNLRVTAFITLAVSGLIPLAHGIIIYGFRRMWIASGMPYYLLEGGILVLGAFFYATRCPESIKPGRFDVWGCSHNIFHVLVVAATVVHLVGIWRGFAFHYGERKC